MSNATQTWLGVDASDLSFGLDFAPVSLAVTNGELTLNQATGAAKVNWSTINGGTVNVLDTVDLSVSGDATINFDGLLSVDGSFTLTQQDAANLSGAPAEFTGAKALVLSLTAAADSDVGGASGTLELIRVSNATQTWLGVDASDLSFGLDFAPVSLAVTNGELTLNQATGAAKVNWSTINGGTVNVLDTVDLSVSGDATINFDGLLSVDGSFTLTQQDAANLSGAPAEFTGAKALVLSLTAAADSDVGGASGTLELIRVSNATQTWLGVDASDLSFGLDFAPVSLAVTNGELTLNQATGAAKVNWSTINGGTVNVLDTVDLSVSGDATINFDGLLSVDGSFTLTQQDAANLSGAPAEFTGAKALVLSLTAAADSDVGGASGTLELIRVSNATQTWLGVDASDLSFGLDFAPVSLAVTNGELTLNQATGAAKVNWSTINGGTVNVLDTVDLSVSGDATINFDGLLSVDGSFT